MIVEVLFPVQGSSLITDNSYLLYSALSHAVPEFHTGTINLRFAPINGDKGDKGMIQLVERSHLRLRLPADQIATVLPLVGRTLRIGAHNVQLKAPTVLPLEAASMLRAKIVTYKNA